MGEGQRRGQGLQWGLLPLPSSTPCNSGRPAPKVRGRAGSGHRLCIPTQKDLP